MSIWQMLGIFLLSISGDLQPNNQVVLGAPSGPRIFLDVQKDGWIDLSVGSDEAAAAETRKLKVENDTFIFQEITPSVAASKDASGNTRINISDALKAGGGSIKAYKPGLVSITVSEGSSGNGTEITVTRNNGNIVIGSPATPTLQIPVTIK